jgi:hypothetical protein
VRGPLLKMVELKVTRAVVVSRNATSTPSPCRPAAS